jgi:ABC-type bacteriocin/lantibiotic exporter with double-glycine peptidase domain
VTTVDFEEFARSFSGVALTFATTERWRTANDEPARDWLSRIAENRWVRAVLSERNLLMKVLVVSGFVQLLALVAPALTQSLLDDALPRGDFDLLLVTAAGATLLTFGAIVIELVRTLYMANMRALLSTRLSFAFVEHLFALPFSFFQRHADGDLLMRLRANNQIREVLGSEVARTLIDGSFAVLFLTLLTLANPLFASVSVLCVAVFTVPYAVVRNRFQQLNRDSIAKRTKTESFEVEMLRASETVKAMGLEREVLEHWLNSYVEAMNQDIKRERYVAKLDVPQLAINGVFGLIFLIPGVWLVLRGSIQVGEMLALVAISGMTVQRLSNFIDALQRFDGIKHHIDLVDDVMEQPREQEGTRTELRVVNGNLRAQDLSFKFSDSAPLVVDGCSLSVSQGAFVAIVGPSGSGKSTLLKILAGLYAPTSGQVFVDGVALTQLDLRSYRSRIAMVTQDTHLFARSIRWNISLGLPQVTLSQIENAAKLAGIHDDIMQMPLGYETPLSDQGRSLSGGQRQRLALARALLRKPRLLLLDEATSAMDAVTEAQVSANIAALGCTRIVVAHRIGTVRHANTIFTMQDGRIVEQGTHDELLQRGGLYASLAG